MLQWMDLYFCWISNREQGTCCRVTSETIHMTGLAWFASRDFLFFLNMATKAAIPTPPSPLPSTASTLWGRLLGHDLSKTNTAPLHAQLTPQDKAGTSTRILLHDTHARLEIFSERANSILSGIEASRREMVRVREEVENAREKELDTIAQLSMFFTHICLSSCSSKTYIIYMRQSTDASLLSKGR
jgi:hypothetical protein